jgi:ankyrin repeat protein
MPSTIGKTPIQYAFEKGNEAVVLELLDYLNSDLRATILPHWSSATGQAKVLALLLNYPEILANIDKKDTEGKTAL